MATLVTSAPAIANRCALFLFVPSSCIVDLRPLTLLRGGSSLWFDKSSSRPETRKAGAPGRRSRGNASLDGPVTVRGLAHGHAAQAGEGAHVDDLVDRECGVKRIGEELALARAAVARVA